MEALITISYICTIIFGILSIILFIKLWAMTNDIKEIKDRLIHKLTYRDNFRLLMLQGEKEKAFIYAKNELTERLERLFMTYPKYETFMGQSRKIIDKYNKMTESTGFQLPEHLQNAEKYIEYRKYIISITQQD